MRPWNKAIRPVARKGANGEHKPAWLELLERLGPDGIRFGLYVSNEDAEV